MKRILTAIAALAMVAGLASCQKENDSVNGSSERGLKKVTVRAAIAEASKVTYSEKNNALTPAWEENDKILVINEDNSASMLEVTEINGNVATLEGEAKDGLAHLVYMEGVNTSSWVSNKIEFSYDNQSGNNDMPAVMLADGEISKGCGEFIFANAGAVLGIYNAKGVPANSAISKVTVSGSNLSKATISINDDALKLAATAKADDAISTAALSNITVADGTTGALSTPIYIAVPAGAKVAKVTLSVGTDTYTYTLAAAKECKANDYLYIKASEFKKDSNLPAGALKGEFTVSADGKKVHFSQGNLWYGKDGEAQTATFNFEANQYSSASSWEASHVSHFYWSKDVDEAVKQEFNFDQSMSADDVFFTNVDGFKINVGGKEQSGWRTLSTKEWQYLFNTRTMKNGKDRYTLNITYGGKMGLVLYPDDYDSDPISGSVETMPEGVVFLPAAGYRGGSGDSGVFDVGGRYWSSSADGEDCAYDASFTGSSVIPGDYDYRNLGFSVRLVTEVK